MKQLLVAAVALLAQEKVLFEDKFAAKPGEGWTWVREDASGWKVEGGGLRLKSLPGTIWYKKNDAKNLLVRKLTAAGTESEPLAIEVTVESAPEINAEQAGLFFYFDDSNYLKIVRESLKGKPNIVLAREQKGIPEHVAPKEEPAPSVRLRLTWAGAKIKGSYKAGGDWLAVGEYDVPAGDGAPSVALGSHGAPVEADRWAKFTDFRLLKPAK